MSGCNQDVLVQSRQYYISSVENLEMRDEKVSYPIGPADNIPTM